MPDTRPHYRALLVAGALLVGTLALYLATLTEVHTFDALSYVTSVERKPWTELFHPHHLAYGPLGALMLALGQALGYGGGAALPMQALNAVAGALGVALLFGVAHRATGRLDAALAAALLQATAYAYWYYAVEVEVYTVASLFLVACLDLLVRPGPWSARRCLALGLAQGGAVLFHQTNALLCAPVAVCALADWLARRQDRAAVAGRWALYGLALALTVSLPYLYAMLVVSGFRTPAAMWAWLTEYARTGWWGGPLGATTGARLAQGLAETLAQPGGGWLWLALAVAAGWSWRSRRPGAAPPAAGTPVAALLVWLAAYGAFFTWWEPDNVEFWIASLPPALLLLALLLARPAPWSPPIWLALGVAAAALWLNFAAISRRGDAATDLQRLVARELAARSTPADLLIVPDGLLELYLPHYEARENSTSLNQALFDAGGDWARACGTIRARIERARHAGATALIAAEALHPPDELLARHRLRLEQVDACFAPYRAELLPLDMPAPVPAYLRLPLAAELAAGAGWRFEQSGLGWQAAGVTSERFEGGWRLTPAVDPALLSPLMRLDAERFAAIELRLTNGTGARDAQLFFADGAGRIDEARSLRWELRPGAASYRLELRDAPGWAGVITRLRLDPVGVGDGGEIIVEQVRLIPARAGDAVVGRDTAAR